MRLFNRPKQWLLTAGTLTLLPALAITAPLAAAQDATPGGEPEQDVVTALPVGIHAGFCVDGVEPEPAYIVGVLGPVAGEDGEVPLPGDIRGFQTSPPVLTVDETIDVPLDELLDAPHALVVQAGEEASDTFVACAELGGPVEDDELVVGIRPLNGSGYYGTAILEVESGTPIIGDDALEVTVYLFQDVGPAGPAGVTETGTAEGMPMAGAAASPMVDGASPAATSPDASPETSPIIDIATPVGDQGAPEPGATGELATELSVESYDIYFEPAEITIPADTDVTVSLPNLGAAPHNFSVDELDIDVDIAPGATEETVINAPAGEYKYYCDVPGHEQAGMVGTLIVQ
ncbi:MAG: cupredoxin domain-containing protein [Chloroflexota bacterium]|nr:cupredoxin domain-containing protein [Chloroflexota bacterium]